MISGVHVVVDARMIRHAGIGTYIRNLVPRIAARRPTWRFSLLIPHGCRDDLAVTAERIWCRSEIYSVAEQLELPRILPRDATLLWSPHWNVPLASRLPFVVTVHDVAHLARPEHSGPVRMARLLYARTFLKRIRRRARGIVFVSEFSRGEFERHVGTARNGAVVANGVDEEWFTSPPPTTPRPHDRPYILFVGSVKPHKNVGGLLRAFAQLQDSSSHDLLIAGAYDGMRTVDEDSLGAARALGSRVRFLGRVEDDQLRALVAGADAFVFPSFYEGFGFPPLEAMAAGTPCVISRIPALVEVCGDAAIHCDPADPTDIAAQIRRVIQEPDLRRELSDRGRRRAALFTWDRSADLTARVLADAARDPGR